MNKNEFNKDDIKQSFDYKNKQPDEFEHTVESSTVDESKKVRFNFKDDIKKKTAQFLFLVVGASLTITGLEIMPLKNKNTATINIEEITETEIFFTFYTNFNGATARVYNDFEKLSCPVELDKIDDNTYQGYGRCDSLRSNTTYTVSIDGKEVLGNCSLAKKSFTTKRKDINPDDKYLERIQIEGELEKYFYIEGEIFNPKGLSVFAYFSNNEVIDVTNKAIWDQNPLTLNSQYVTVSYTYDGVEKNEYFTDFHVESQIIHVSDIILKSSQIALQKGEELYLEYNILPSNATDQRVTFTSSNNECATIDENGLIRALEIGETTISVKTIDGGFEASLVLIVEEYQWQNDVHVETSLDRINENLLIYKIMFGDEISNISQVIFRYYTISDEPEYLMQVVKDVMNYDPVTKESTFLVELGNLVGLGRFQDVLFVIRNGEEEALCYSSAYDLSDINK